MALNSPDTKLFSAAGFFLNSARRVSSVLTMRVALLSTIWLGVPWVVATAGLAFAAAACANTAAGAKASRAEAMTRREMLRGNKLRFMGWFPWGARILMVILVRCCLRPGLRLAWRRAR